MKLFERRSPTAQDSTNTQTQSEKACLCTHMYFIDGIIHNKNNSSNSSSDRWYRNIYVYVFLSVCVRQTNRLIAACICIDCAKIWIWNWKRMFGCSDDNTETKKKFNKQIEPFSLICVAATAAVLAASLWLCLSSLSLLLVFFRMHAHPFRNHFSWFSRQKIVQQAAIQYSTTIPCQSIKRKTKQNKKQTFFPISFLKSHCQVLGQNYQCDYCMQRQPLFNGTIELNCVILFLIS